MHRVILTIAIPPVVDPYATSLDPWGMTRLPCEVCVALGVSHCKHPQTYAMLRLPVRQRHVLLFNLTQMQSHPKTPS